MKALSVCVLADSQLSLQALQLGILCIWQTLVCLYKHAVDYKIMCIMKSLSYESTVCCDNLQISRLLLLIPLQPLLSLLSLHGISLVSLCLTLWC